RYKPYKGPAPAWRALISVTKASQGSSNAQKNMRIIHNTKHNAGFDCPGSAMRESPERGMVKICQNAAKTLTREEPYRRV
ncbi:CbbBc protein, partial [Pseudomonas syringae pv. tagetis]